MSRSETFKSRYGVLAQIPNIEFDESLLKISAPQNIPKEHQDKLNSVLTNQ